MKLRPLALLVGAVLVCTAVCSRAAVIISEVHYHPVELATFNANGTPVLDLSEDVHEFVEIHNPDSNAVSLAGWRLTGSVDFTFPTNASIAPGAFRVIARNPARLAAVPQYGLAASNVFGPYTNQLGNNSGTVRLRDASGDEVDSVGYSAQFPWAIGADALGADDEWTGLNSSNFQYRGRSLERVSFTHNANDPANWVASPLNGNPSPGRTNSVSLPAPRPVVIAFSVAQAADEAPIIRASQPVRIEATFSATNQLGEVAVEWFVDDINLTNEVRATNSMSVVGPAENAAFSVVLPGQVDRSIVRFRIRATRGKANEVVSPRADDPFAWHAYFVTPVRSSTRPVYDCFISSNSLVVLNANISGSPRRVLGDAAGTPRASWNATEPAVFVENGIVRDIRMRHHGSRYNRGAGRNSFKWAFPRYNEFQGTDSMFETDKGSDFVVGHGLFIEAGLPVSSVRYVDLYLNNDGVRQRLEQGEFNGDMLDAFHKRQRNLNPGTPLEASGEIYKSTGTIEENGEGPYGRGDGRKLVKPPYWTDLQMYDWTYAQQSHGWKGMLSFKTMLDGLWAARGDTHTALNPNIPAMRAYLSNTFDIDATLTYLAVENWACPWDDTTQNHFLWQRANGRWGMLPWDCDAWFGRGDNTPATSSIYIGEVGDPNNNFRGPNFIKDSLIKAFRTEYRQKMFLLNNTFLHPDNINAMGFGAIASFATARFAAVNSQLADLGPFTRPNQPLNLAPAANATALPPMQLQASTYSHSTNPAPAHAYTVWELRASDGSYSAPLWKSTTTSNLTSIAIPFAELTFGQTYFWRCTYYDTNGRPSLPSVETSFAFGPQSAQVTLVGIDGAFWKYNQGFTADPPADWKNYNFDDSGWSNGPALLAVENCNCLPEPIRTTLTIGRTTYYFRRHFNFPGSPQGAQLRLRHVVDDGLVIYLNGTEIHRTNMPAGTPTYATFSSVSVGDAAYSSWFNIPATALQARDNVLAVEVHQSNAGSSDIVFGLNLEGTVPAVSGDLVINEIGADNRGSVRNGRASPDWVELFNNTGQAINLSGSSLSDDVLQPLRYVFPTNTIVPAQGYLVVWCDKDTNAPGLHTGFNLDNDGQTLVLFTPGTNGLAIRDVVQFGLQIPDRTIGRVANGTGGWTLTTPTPGAANVSAPTGNPAGLRVNEWLAAPSSGDDWFELFNPDSRPVALGGFYLTDTPANPTASRIPDLSFIDGDGFARFWADSAPAQGANHANFKLSASGESLAVFGPGGTNAYDSISFGPQTTGVSQGRWPDGSATLALFPSTASPAESNYLPLTNSVVINEVLTHTDLPLEDAIELLNPTGSAIDLSGWFLSDDKDRLKKFRIPNGTVLPAGGFKVFYEAQLNADTNSPRSFSLDSTHGDQVYLSVGSAAGTNLLGYRNDADFGAAAPGISFGRYQTSVEWDFTALSQRTFGADLPTTVEQFRTGTGLANAYPLVGPIVINEVMYHPPDVGTNDNTHDEFIELINIAATPVPLFDPAFPTNTWRLRDAVSFQLPTNLVLAAGARLLLVGFDPLTNALTEKEFRGAYGLSNDVPLYGPWSGKLDNSTESVELVKPGEPVATGPETGYVPEIVVDRVRYRDLPPWPILADGSGASLQRLVPSNYGNDPANWFANGRSPGALNGSNLPPEIALTAPTNGTSYPFAASVTMEAAATDADGSVTLVEFYVDGVKLGQDSVAPFAFTWTNATGGAHQLTARATDDDGFSTLSAPVSVQVALPPNLPPGVALTQPTNGAIYQAPVFLTLQATATDADGVVTNVEFFDGGTRLGGAGTPPYQFVWSGVSTGLHTLTARATDDRSASSTSTVVTITVNPPPPNFPPSVALTAPAAGSLQALGGPIQLIATASDTDGTVSKIEFYDGATKLGEDLAAPYSFTWTNAALGMHALRAVATDNGLATNGSAPTVLAVVNSLSNRVTLIATGSVWRYFDQGVDQGTNWINLGFDDAGWSNGVAELGYGDSGEGRPEATVVGFGPNANDKYPTTYFRNSINLGEAASFSSLEVRLMRDDGGVVYLNGTEVFRSNLPAAPATISYGTLANGSIPNNEEFVFFTNAISPALLRNGKNQLAVEIHQATAASSDLSFDLELSGLQSALAPAIFVQPEGAVVNSGSTVVFSAVAAGSEPLRYQWRYEGSPIPGATNASLTLSNAQLANAGGYTLLVTNLAGSATSDAANLIVNQSAPPQIDLSGGAGLALTWPVSAGGYQLYVATNLSPPVLWIPATDKLITNAGTIRAAIATTNEQRFYRLQVP